MKHYWGIASIFVAIFLVFGGIIAYTNYYSYQQRMEEQRNVESIKQAQQRIDDEFNKQQQEKEYQSQQTGSSAADIIRIQNQQIESAKQAEQSASSQDRDGDGLTAAEEARLGTNDNSRDSDLDGVPDGEDAHPAGGGENYKLTVNWEHNGKAHTTQFGIPSDRYTWYRNKPRKDFYYQDGRFATPTDPSIVAIADDVGDVARLEGSDPTNTAIDFVESMTYQYDIEYNNNPEYPKYAIETIVDERGDCEDTSFLMASILKALNVDTVILLYSDHAAVGVWCNGCTGTYYTHNGRKYYFLETTGWSGNWQIGQIWGKYGDETPKIIEVH